MTTIEQAFGGLVQIYQLYERLSASGARAEDALFYAHHAREAGAPTVELGVGCGRLTASISPDVGIDIAEEMLAATRSRAPETSLVRADFEQYELPVPAAFTFAAGNALDNVLTTDALVRVFANVHRQSQPGARFAFDALDLPLDALRAANRRVLCDGVVDSTVLFSWFRLTDLQTRERELLHFVDVVDEDGVATERRYFPLTRARCFSPSEFRSAFTLAGWREVGAWGGFGGEPIDGATRRQVWLLERP